MCLLKVSIRELLSVLSVLIIHKQTCIQLRFRKLKILSLSLFQIFLESFDRKKNKSSRKILDLHISMTFFKITIVLFTLQSRVSVCDSFNKLSFINNASDCTVQAIRFKIKSNIVPTRHTYDVAISLSTQTCFTHKTSKNYQIFMIKKRFDCII